jgi:pilus assembly protein FimV
MPLHSTSDIVAPSTVVPVASPPFTDSEVHSQTDLDFDVGETARATALVDPFSASAFGSGDPTARTAVNLPAFKVRAGQDGPSDQDVGGDDYTASAIFGSSLVADNAPIEDSRPLGDTEVLADEPPSSEPLPVRAAEKDGRHVLDSQAFERTETHQQLADINLDLDREGDFSATNIEPPPAAAVASDVWQAMATKLDLALAYNDIGDREGARELLEEVVRNGDAAQADRARLLISSMD